METDAQPDIADGSSSVDVAGDDDEISQPSEQLVKPDASNFYGKACPPDLARAAAAEASERRRRAAENLPPFIVGQPEAVIRRWKYHAARSMRAGKPGKESGDKLDDMIKTYGPKWRRQQDSTAEQAIETDRAGQYAGLPDDAYALAVRCDLSIGEILHRDSLGMCMEPVEQLIADTAREFVREKPSNDARERFAAINAIIQEHYCNG